MTMDYVARIQEWQKQSQYDLETAQAMLKTGRYVYCIFMCHLLIEKTLKGLYLQNLKEPPPKIHSLVYLAQVQRLDLSEEIKKFLEKLDEVSVPTRYPDQLDQLIAVYDAVRTQTVLQETQEVLACLNKKFLKP